MLVPSVSTVLGLAAALGSAVAATVPTEARQVEQLEDDGAFLITRAFLTKPASRPGSYKYCSIIREFSHLRWKPQWVHRRSHPGGGGGGMEQERSDIQMQT